MTSTQTDTVSAQVMGLEARHVLGLYRRAPIVLVRGEGVRVWDAEGREYLDLISGVGVTTLGHANRGLADALADQARTLAHCSNLFYHPLQGQLAERLSALSGLDRVFFCNSGTEAMEACLKFARRYWHSSGDTDRTDFVALEGSFHGRTFGSVSVTSTEAYRRPFGPLVPGVRFVDPADPAALASAVTPKTAAIVVEAIQGEGGVRRLTPEFAAAVEAACRTTGALLVCDEVQCGLGRTGYPFHFGTLGLTPDLVAVGKALGAGFPIGAAITTEAVASALHAGDHGSTYGGNLLACRAGLYFVEQLLAGGLLAHVDRVSARLSEGLAGLAARHPVVTEIRGAGLMRGLALDRPAAPFVDAAREHGLLVNATASTVLRMLPALTIEESELDEALVRLDAAFTAVKAQS